jgi:hypothetical protein
MARADRLARTEVRLAALEAEYKTALIDALRITASGKWGLFDHQGHAPTRKATAPVIDHLADLAGAINDARDQLSLPSFDLHQEFIAARGPVRADAVGEPKQARAWLERLGKDGPGQPV